ncbi:hypothetical protein C8Q80DRAFT_531266 [Daedaleopsis nitida]|nr:hypothetical protein C8Q80DRAFT_531266 [Daedaleopsis nitida]
MDAALTQGVLDVPHAESSKAAIQRQSPICVICQAKSAIYTCPRCNLRTCSLPCSTKHKTLENGCSGIRNKAAYVPMNQYGYMTLMNDYSFLEEVGRQVGEWGREIVQGGFTPTNGSGDGAGRGRGRGRGDLRGRGRGRGRGGAGAQGKTTSKRDVLKMQLDFRDIELEFLPNGMERRTLNQSTWDFKNRTALLTVEFKFHPPRDLLAPTRTPDPPFALLTHRTTLETPLLAAVQMHVTERSKSKKDKDKSVPPWVQALVLPDEDVADSFITPLFVMGTPLDPLAALNSSPHVPHPGRLLRTGYYKLDASQPLGAVLKHKHFVEFPTIEIWEEDAFQGTVVDDRGAVVHESSDEHRPKRRKLNAKQAKKAISGLLGGYGSDGDEEGGEEDRSVMNLLGSYAESDEEADAATAGGTVAGGDVFDEDAWGDEDAEGETDDDYDDRPEELAAMLQKLREAGALRDPGADGVLIGYGGADDEQVDWGESGDEDDGGT